MSDDEVPELSVCPACGKLGVPIVYGLPDHGLMEAAERGEVALGGCIIHDDDPSHECPECGHHWVARR